MPHGQAFLEAQVNNAVMQHRTLVTTLRHHAAVADDARYVRLCETYAPLLEAHCRVISTYQHELQTSPGLVKRATAAVLGTGLQLADAVREDDFLRLVSDLGLGRQAEDTNHTFRDAGRTLGNARLATIGAEGEAVCGRYVTAATRLISDLFAERAQSGSDPRPPAGSAVGRVVGRVAGQGRDPSDLSVWGSPPLSAA